MLIWLFLFFIFIFKLNYKVWNLIQNCLYIFFDFFSKYDELLILYIYFNNFNNFYICIIIDFIIYDITSSTIDLTLVGLEN